VLTATLLPKNPARPAEDDGLRPAGGSRAPRACGPAPAASGSRSLASAASFALPRRRLEFFAFTLVPSTLVGGLALFLNRRFGFNVENVLGLRLRPDRRLRNEGDRSSGQGYEEPSPGFVTMAIGYCFLQWPSGMPPVVLLLLVAVSGFGVAVTLAPR
jgi:hypothetical protein